MSRDLAMHALDLQIDESKWVATIGGQKYCNAIYNEKSLNGPAIVSGTIRGVGYKLDREGAVLVLRNLIASETYAVTDEIGEVLDFGAKTIPSFMLHESDPPSESGFVVFESTHIIPDGKGKPLAVKAIAWDTVKMRRDMYDEATMGVVDDTELERFKREHADIDSVSGVLLIAYTDPTDERDHMHEEWQRDLWMFRAADFSMPPLLPLSCGLWEFGREPLEEYAHDSLIRLLATFFRFVQEPWVDPRTIVTGRHVRKRAIKVKIEPSVHVVQLRKRAGSHARTNGESQPGNYSHRWLVRGFWRNQWYPSEQRHAPKFIAPHVRGPADKPLVVHDTIFSVDR